MYLKNEGKSILWDQRGKSKKFDKIKLSSPKWGQAVEEIAGKSADLEGFFGKK